MKLHAADNLCHKNQTSRNNRASRRLAGRIVSDLNWLRLLDTKDNILEESFHANQIDHDLENLYRQRWKIE